MTSDDRASQQRDQVNLVAESQLVTWITKLVPHRIRRAGAVYGLDEGSRNLVGEDLAQLIGDWLAAHGKRTLSVVAHPVKRTIRVRCHAECRQCHH